MSRAALHAPVNLYTVTGACFVVGALAGVLAVAYVGLVELCVRRATALLDSAVGRLVRPTFDAVGAPR